MNYEVLTEDGLFQLCLSIVVPEVEELFLLVPETSNAAQAARIIGIFGISLFVGSDLVKRILYFVLFGCRTVQKQKIG